MSTTFQNRIADRLKLAIEEMVFPGCCFGIVDATGNKWILPQGTYRYLDKKKIDANSVFDCASLTKVVPTATVALILIQKKNLSLSTSISTIIPECRGTYQDLCTVHHLLTHTVDWGLRMSLLKSHGPNQILEALYTKDLVSMPGSTYSYANASSIILGIILERITGKSLDYLAQTYIFDALQMNDSTFFPARLSHNRIVPTEIDSFRNREICGEVHDESAWVLRPQIVAGSAGLFSTVPNLLNYIEMHLNTQKYRNQTVLNEQTKEMISNNQIGNLGYAGLGVELYQQEFMGSNASQKCLGKTGFTGCSMVFDRTRGVGFVLLSNSTHPKRHPDKTLISKVRKDLADYVWDEF